jgi:hypothetical protein
MKFGVWYRETGPTGRITMQHNEQTGNLPQSPSPSTSSDECAEIAHPFVGKIEKKSTLRRVIDSAFPGINETADSTTKLTTGLTHLLPQLENFLQNSNSMSLNMSQATQSIQRLIDGLNDIVKEVPLLKDFQNNVIDAVILLFDILVAYFQRNWFGIPTIVYRLFNLFGLARPLIDAFLARISPLFRSTESNQDVEEVVAQADFDLSSILSLGLGLIITREMPSGPRLQEVLNKMRLKALIGTEVKTVVDMIFGFLRSLPDEMQDWLQYVMPIKWWVNLFKPGMPYFCWIDEVVALDTHQTRLLAAFDRPTQQRITAAYNLGVKLVQDATSKQVRLNQVSLLLKKYLDKIEELYSVVDVAASQRQYRREPFSIYLYGESGVGKTFLTTSIPAFLARTPHGHNNLMYQRNSAIAYWDGYTQQFATNFDDFALSRETKVVPGSFAEWEACVSNNQYILPMASLEDKGLHFNSQVVLATSNQGYPVHNDYPNIEPFWRRRHLLVKVSVLPEYCKPGTNQLDPTRIDPNDHTFPFWVFEEYHNTLPIRGVLNRWCYVEFKEVLRQRFDAHIAKEQQARAAHEMMVEDMAAEFQDAEDDEEEVHAQGLLADAILCPGTIIGISGLVGRGAGMLAETAARKFYAELLRIEMSEPVHDIVRKVLRWVPIVATVCGALSMYCIFQRYSQYEERKANDLETDRIMKRMATFDPMSCVAEGVYAGSPHKNSPATKTLRPQRIPQVVRIMPEGATDPNAVEIMENIVIGNMARIEVGPFNKTQALFVKGTLLLAPRHVFLDTDGEVFKTRVDIIVKTEGPEFHDIFDADRFVEFEGDVAFYCMNINTRTFKDISHLFIKDNSLDLRSRFNGRLVKMSSRRYIIPETVMVEGNVKAVGYNPIPGAPPPSDRRFHVIFRDHQCWQYNAVTTPGNCGAPLMAFEPKMERKLVGIHVGSKNAHAIPDNYDDDIAYTGYATVVTSEMVLEALEHLPQLITQIPKPMAGLITDLSTAQVYPQGNFSYMGVLPQPIYSSSRTCLEKSFIHGVVAQTYRGPSVLSPRDPRLELAINPMEEGIRKYGQISPVIDDRILLRVQEHLHSIFAGFSCPIPKEIFSELISINGHPESEYAEALNMDTAPGWPYSQMTERCGKGKKFLFVEEDGYYKVSNPDLRLRLDFREKCAYLGQRVPSLWVDTMKDELRPLQKVREGKTRIFTQPPVDYVIFARRLLMSFSTAFYANRLRFFSIVGISPEADGAYEWTQLYFRLTRNSPVGFAGDYSGWDGTIAPQAIQMTCDLINAWYNDDIKFQNARKVLFHELIHTVQGCSNIVYISHRGNPSGNPLTTPLNTIVGAIYLRVVWLELAPPEFNSLVSFDENVVDAINGDDNQVSVKTDVLHFFNPHAISECLRKYGITYTSALKDGEAKMDSIDNLTILKRGFRLGRGIERLPTMEKRVAYDMTNWVRKSETPVGLCLDNCNEGLRFMFFHGKEEFDVLRRKILAAIPLRLHCKIHDYSYFYGWCYNVNCRESAYSSVACLEGTRKYTQLLDEQCETALNVQNGLGCEFSDPTAIVSRALTALDANMENLRKQNDLATCVAIHEEIEQINSQSSQQSNTFRTMENTQGIISLAQRDEVVQDPTLGQSVVSHRLTTPAIKESTWSLSDMTSRRVLENVYAWTTAHAMHTALATYQLPMDAITSAFQAAAFERFTYYHGPTVASIKINGTRLHQGNLIMWFVPFIQDAQVVPWHATSWSAVTSLAHVIVDAASSNPGKLRIPFYNPKSFLTLNTNRDPKIDFTGTLYVSVFQPLEAAGSTATSINFNIWFEFPEHQDFQVPLYTAAVSRFSRVTARRTRYQPEVEYEEEEEVYAQGNTITNMTKVTNHGKMNDLALPTYTVGDEIGHGAQTDLQAKVSTMDKPAWTLNPIAVYRYPFQNLCNTVGTEMCNRLTLNQSSQAICIPEHFSTEQDEMEMKYLLTRPTYAHEVDWAAANLPGAVIDYGFIGPMGNKVEGADFRLIAQPLTPYAVVRPTLFDYVAKGFKFYTGGFRIQVRAVCTQFSTGHLFLGVHYGQFGGLADELRAGTSQYGIVLDLQNEDRVWTFDIPYKAPTPWLETYHGGTGTELVGGLGRYFTGIWSLRVLNQLVAPDNAPPNARIIISYCGSDDFQVYYPDEVNTTLQPLAISTTITDSAQQYTEIEEISAQMDGKGSTTAEGGDDSVPMPTLADDAGTISNTVVISPEPVKKTEKDMHFREPFTHLGQLLKRYVPINNLISNTGVLLYAALTTSDLNQGFTEVNVGPNNTAFIGWVGIPTVPFVPTTLGAGTFPVGTLAVRGNCSPMASFGLMYDWYRGSRRYKFVWPSSFSNSSGVKIDCCQRALFFTSNVHSNANPDPSGLTVAASMVNYASTIFGVDNNAASFTPAVGNLGIASPALAINICPEGATYNEVEIPFTTIYNQLKTPTGIAFALDTPEVVTVGTLWAAFIGICSNADFTTLKTAGELPISYSVYHAAGDDFRYGTLLGPPLCRWVPRTTATANYPQRGDFWSFSFGDAVPKVPKRRPGNLQLKRGALDQSPDDFEQITAQMVMKDTPALAKMLILGRLITMATGSLRQHFSAEVLEKPREWADSVAVRLVTQDAIDGPEVCVAREVICEFRGENRGVKLDMTRMEIFYDVLRRKWVGNVLWKVETSCGFLHEAGETVDIHHTYASGPIRKLIRKNLIDGIIHKAYQIAFDILRKNQPQVESSTKVVILEDYIEQVFAQMDRAPKEIDWRKVIEVCDRYQSHENMNAKATLHELTQLDPPIIVTWDVAESSQSPMNQLTSRLYEATCLIKVPGMEIIKITGASSKKGAMENASRLALLDFKEFALGAYAKQRMCKLECMKKDFIPEFLTGMEFANLTIAEQQQYHKRTPSVETQTSGTEILTVDERLQRMEEKLDRIMAKIDRALEIMDATGEELKN